MTKTFLRFLSAQCSDDKDRVALLALQERDAYMAIKSENPSLLQLLNT